MIEPLVPPASIVAKMRENGFAIIPVEPPGWQDPLLEALAASEVAEKPVGVAAATYKMQVGVKSRLQLRHRGPALGRTTFPILNDHAQHEYTAASVATTAKSAAAATAAATAATDEGRAVELCVEGLRRLAMACFDAVLEHCGLPRSVPVLLKH